MPPREGVRGAVRCERARGGGALALPRIHPAGGGRPVQEGSEDRGVWQDDIQGESLFQSGHAPMIDHDSIGLIDKTNSEFLFF